MSAAKVTRQKRRCTKDIAGLPCKPCEREAAAIAREVARQAESKRQQQLEREAACARLAEARRAAVLERERLAHEMDLQRMERETQREELDAERTRSSQQGARTKRGLNRADTASKGGAKATGGGGGSGGNASGVTGRPAVGGDNAAASTKRSRKQQKGGLVGSSTLLLVATAAAEGNPRGIMDALQVVPPSEREKISHELAVALEDEAYQWFPPSSGGEPVLALPPTARTTQALGLMAKGKWVKARTTLATALKDTENSENTPASATAKRDPSAVYALALCDHHLGGGAEFARQLCELAAAERKFWPGPPESHLPPGARAFPLGALVHSYLEANTPPALPTAPSVVGAEADDGVGAGDGAGAGADEDTSDDNDPKLRACLLAVSFLRAPAHNRKAGKGDSPGRRRKRW